MNNERGLNKREEERKVKKVWGGGLWIVETNEVNKLGRGVG